MNTQHGVLIGSIALAFVAGIGGGALYNVVSPTSPNLSSGSEQTIIQQETVRTKIFESGITDVAQKVSPAVVSIIVTKDLTRYYRDPFEYFYQRRYGIPAPELRQERRQVGGGTGFILSQDGMIITNKHVVDDPDADYTAILNDGSEVPVKVLSKDPIYDIAVVQLTPEDTTMYKNLPTVTLGDSDSLQVGEVVVAIGNALAEYENTVTMGVLSGKGRSIVAGDYFGQSEVLSNLLQTDAAINPGNSGGPLVNLDGEVIGINTAIASDAQGIGFAIPVNQIKDILPDLETYGKIVHPFLGVNYQMITPQLAKKLDLNSEYGALLENQVDAGITAVVPDSAADNAGLQSGDIILKIDDTELRDGVSLQDVILTYDPQDQITMTILRGETEMTLTATLDERSDESQTEQEEVYLGVRITPITPELAKQFDLSVTYGALIENDIEQGLRGVIENSPAEKAGLRAGDIIIAVGNTSLETNNDLPSLLQSYSPGDTVTLTILRNNIQRKVQVTLTAPPTE